MSEGPESGMEEDVYTHTHIYIYIYIACIGKPQLYLLSFVISIV
jgi:hypothetical protein